MTSFADIGVFFGVLMVGFAYVWKRGDLDWVRAVTAAAAAAGITGRRQRERWSRVSRFCRRNSRSNSADRFLTSHQSSAHSHEPVPHSLIN